MTGVRVTGGQATQGRAIGAQATGRAAIDNPAMGPHGPGGLAPDGLELSVWLVVTPNVMMLDYAGPAETLRMARDMGARLTLRACSPNTQVPTSLGTRLDGLEPLPARLPPNSLVVVAGNSNELEDYARSEALAVVDWLKAAVRADTRLASICSGALLLAKAGWLAGRRCTTHHTLIDTLRAWEPGALVEADRVFVEDGPVLTSAGITTGIDLALHIVERHAGPELAARIARRMVMYQRRGVHDTQLSPWLDHRNHLHPAVHRAQDAICQAPEQPWSLAELARRAHVSPRHLSRLFAQHTGVSVVAYQQRLRIARAQALWAEHPQWPVERMAAQCGFSSARDFRRVWGRCAGGAPGAARRRGAETATATATADVKQPAGSRGQGSAKR